MKREGRVGRCGVGVERVGMCQGRDSGCVWGEGCVWRRGGKEEGRMVGAGRGRRREHGRVGRKDEVERE